MQNIFECLISFADATIEFGLGDSTLRKAVKDGRLKEGVDVKKFGTCWVAKRQSIERLYKKKN